MIKVVVLAMPTKKKRVRSHVRFAPEYLVGYLVTAPMPPARTLHQASKLKAAMKNAKTLTKMIILSFGIGMKSKQNTSSLRMNAVSKTCTHNVHL